MAEWISPVQNRTQEDVDYAISQIKSGNNSSEFKGCFNVTDINRIENNTRYIADRLNVLKYTNTIETKSWDMYGLPNITEVTRLINNVSKIISAYYKPADAPNLPSTLLTYEQANALEKMLYMIKHLIDNEENEFRHCGTFNCGEEW
jgi:hypothetical protein